MIAAKRLDQVIRRFGAAEAGVAAVEFALVVPIMLLLYVGAIEASVLISTDQKVQVVSSTVGDLVARSNAQISTGDLDDYVQIASGLVSPFTAEDMVQTVSQIQILADGTTNVDWSRGYLNQSVNTAHKHNEGTAYELPDELVEVAKGQWVIVAETSLPYTPLFGIVYRNPINLYRRTFFMPRFDGAIELN